MISMTVNTNQIALPTLPTIKLPVAFIRSTGEYFWKITKGAVINKYVDAFFTVWTGPIE